MSSMELSIRTFAEKLARPWHVMDMTLPPNAVSIAGAVIMNHGADRHSERQSG
jgi:hypothetical protein